MSFIECPTSIPFVGFIPVGVQVGTRIIIKGQVPKNSKQFDINLVCLTFGHQASLRVCEKADIALHLNPRFNSDLIVLNSREKMTWDDELRLNSIDKTKWHQFELLIAVTPEYFSIDLNGFHFTTFAHRLPFKDIGLMWISGSVTIDSIKYIDSDS